MVDKLTLPAKENAVQLKINEIIDNSIDVILKTGIGDRIKIDFKDNEIIILADKFEQSLKKTKRRVTTTSRATGQIEQDFYSVKLSKPIIDEIDKLLARHYGFTEEELDFIINYDIKYRMGDELNDE